MNVFRNVVILASMDRAIWKAIGIEMIDGTSYIIKNENGLYEALDKNGN